MKMSATVRNSFGKNEVKAETAGEVKSINIPSKKSGYGSSVNGGELLLISVATCFCNDIYREAAKLKISVSEVEVTASAEFGAEGEPGTNFVYTVKLESDASEKDIRELISHTDKVAEIHNTIRRGRDVKLQMAFL